MPPAVGVVYVAFLRTVDLPPLATVLTAGNQSQDNLSLFL